MSESAKQFFLAVLAIILIGVAFEVYPPLGVSLFVIALATLFLSAGAIV